MNESNSTETLTNTHSNLNASPPSDQTKFRLDEINKIKEYFIEEIRKRKAISKKLSKTLLLLIILTRL